MKRLLENFKVGIALVGAFLILFALCCIAGGIAVLIAKIFTTSFKVIMTIGAIGYCAMIGAVIFFSLKLLKKCEQKNSQKDTRK